MTRAAALADPAALRSLTLMSSGPAAIPAPADTGVGLMLQALPVMDLEAIWAAKRQIESQTELAPPRADIEAWLHDRFVANHPMGLHRVAEQLLSEPDRTDELAALDLPVLVLLGEHDDVWPPALQAEMADRLGAAAVVLPDAGHSPAADLPEVTAQPADLLGRHRRDLGPTGQLLRPGADVAVVQQRRGDQEVGGRQVAGHRDVPDGGDPQQCLDVGVVRLRLERVPEEDQQVDAALGDLGADLLVAADRAGRGTG